MNYPEILAGIILHEARHVCQAHLYFTKYSLNYIEFLKYYNKDLATAQIFERDALKVGILYLESAMKKYIKGSTEYNAIEKELQRLNAYLNSNYPDINGDNVFDNEDIKDMREGTLLEMAEYGTHTTTMAVVSNLESQPEVANKYGIIKTLQGSNLNLRSQPSENSTILAKIPNGTTIKIIGEDEKVVTVNGEKGKWLKIDYEGIAGWAWGNFIKKR